MKQNGINYKNFSVHFTTKNQTVDEVSNAWYRFENSVDFPKELTVTTHDDNTDATVHHAFLSLEELSKRGIPTDAVDFVESLADRSTCWTEKFPNPSEARIEMLDELNRNKGICFFIGDTTAVGVREELEYAKMIGLAIHKIGL